jgi:uncharacterized protein with NAD-binding domain and iron-sulfur cluster
MSSSDSRQKVAILGGGISALTTAFELTNASDWQSHYDITVYQMGWRLGGKCATRRGPNDRIEEHGIHGFLGGYYNALPLMAQCYKALNRPSDAPLATFEQAFMPDSFMLMWEYLNGNFKRWPLTVPTNGLLPNDPSSLTTIRQWTAALVRLTDQILDAEHTPAVSLLGLELKAGRALVQRLAGTLDVIESDGHPAALNLLEDVWQALKQCFIALIEGNDDLRRLYVVLEFLFALVRGTLADRIIERGFDVIDDENFSDWLARHGASPMTVSSPLALNTVNLSYQYPEGDTTRSPQMAAGAYLHWSLRSFAYMGAFAWLFAAGTGETVIAPLYLVLRQRGVKFEFFHKVESLGLSPDQTSVASVRMAVQATLKDPDHGYEPLIEVKGLPTWPNGPQYEQLVQGDTLRQQDIDLESYWSPWQPVAYKTLMAGVDYDRVVFAISIGAVPHICGELVDALPPWREMVSKVTTVQTQTMQIWMSKSTQALGWDLPLKNPTDTVIGATYLNPMDGQVDFSHLLAWESWPESAAPKSLWYFSGAMDDCDPPPPFSDTNYPARAHARVKAQCVQYLQNCMGPLLPQATTNAVSPPGDPVGLDFSLLVPYEAANAGSGVRRFDQQFWRANIDPTERYVTSPPGSTGARLKAWDSGLSNLVLAGDWIYTGLNVGSVEGAVMGGRLAAHAVSGLPKLSDIVGYPQPKAD